MPANFYAVSSGLTLPPAAVDHVREVLARGGAHLLEESFAPDARFAVHTLALELETDGAHPDAALNRLRRELAAAPLAGVDTALVPAQLRGPERKFIIMDVDSTLIQQEVIELLAAHAGMEAQVAEVTAAAMRGELDFAASLHARVATLAGLPESVLAEVGAKVKLTDGAERLVREAKAAGHVVAAVSGGFREILAPLAENLGLDHALANELEIVHGVLTGRVLGDVVDRAAKAAALRRWAAAEGIDLAHSIAIGDGANDLDMMAAAGLGVAFNAKPAVRGAADAQINIPFLDVALHLAGI
jgi:phosphoserine phosphatase